MLEAAAICLIISITDGDTLKANCNGETETIRLAEIDAPETRQAYGIQSKTSLSSLCLNKSAKITPQTKDRYGRTIAHIDCAGINANREQIKRGMAWAYDKYALDPNLHIIQKIARTNNRGLWQSRNPKPPWMWRRINN